MYVEVRVTPGAKKELFESASPTAFHIQVKEKAERNLANGRVRELLARHFGTSINNVRIISGHRSPKKIISIEHAKNS